MSYNPNKLTFKVDEITGEIIQPKVFLCDRQLNKIGEIYPVNNLRIKSVLNGADEISFSTPKHVKNYNDKDVAYLNKRAITPITNNENMLYDKLKDYSVVFAEGFGYFEVSPTISDSYVSVKNLQGNSLGESELSQLFCTLECNTNDVITNFLKLYPTKKYIPTVLYSDDDDHKHSLIHQILSYAPNYTVGKVDDTIKNIQRTFSFSNKDIISCFSEIAEEISCIFDVVVRRNDNGTVERVVNIYDAQYCKDCEGRNIINGVCQDKNCGSKNIGGIGEDTTIMISTDNLSDEITLTPDGNMKNCFIVEGGDDIITSTVEGIMPSGNNKLYMFSPDTVQLFSPELKSKYNEYVKGFNSSKEPYEKLLELEYSIFDLILYLQSGRMPTPETTDISDESSGSKLQYEAKHIIEQYNNYFPNGLGLTSDSDVTSRNGMIRQVFSLFVDDGYAVKQENGYYDELSHIWTGDIIVYELGNSSSNATIHVSNGSTLIESSDTDEKESMVFRVKFSEDYPTYLKQMVAIRTKDYELIEDWGTNSAKEWQRYSLNRLYSYKSGYELCIETLNELVNKSSLANAESIAKPIRDEYRKRSEEISSYMTRLEDIIYHLYLYYGNFNFFSSSAPSSLNINYSSYEPKVFKKSEDAFENMEHYIYYGTWAKESEGKRTDHPIYCKSCGSSNVTLTGCNQCKSSNISTYGELAQMVYKSYSSNKESLESQRKKIREMNDLKLYLGNTLYKELCSFIREDVYNNSNFISDGLSNSELIQKSKELIQKAEQELAKACISQHTLSGNIYSFVAYSHLAKDDFPIPDVYKTFKLGNFMWYFADDGKKYKLRLVSEEFSWSESGAELNVDFTDVIEYLNGGISDLASLTQTVGNLSTSFNSVKKQAEQGVQANNTFQKIKNEGLQSALSNVLNARDIDVQIDENGITLRKFDYELDDYSKYQMKLINRNIVMTDDNWETAHLAIGLGYYNNEPRYGVWAELLMGNLIAGEELLIGNKDETVKITGNGITIKKGIISWNDVNSPEISNIKNLAQSLSTINDNITDSAATIIKFDAAVAHYLGLPDSTTLIGENYVISPFIEGGYLNITDESNQNQVIIDPKNLNNNEYIFVVKHGDECTVGIKPNGTASFKGDITATSLKLEGNNLGYDDVVLLDKSTGTKDGTYTCISKNGLLEANNAIIHGTVYATDGNFSGSIECGDGFKVDKNGKVYSKSGQIGGWSISDKDLLSTKTNGFDDEECLETRLLLSGDTCRIASSSLYRYFSGNDSYEKWQYQTYITDGEIQCTKKSIGNTAHDVLKQSLLYLDGDSIKLKYEDTSVPIETIFTVSASSKQLTLNGDMNINGKIRQNRMSLGDLYCVVKTGEPDPISGTGEWEEFSASFKDVTYLNDPFVNVMPTTEFSSENIVFVKFEHDSNGGCTGFIYKIHCAYPETTYGTKWFAVGNIKQ